MVGDRKRKGGIAARRHQGKLAYAAEQRGEGAASGKSCTLETAYPPDALFGKTESSHPDDTGRQLTDGQFGGIAFSDSAFVGKPYVTYVDRDQVSQDYMFDDFVFLPYGPLLNGANFAANTAKPTNKTDWEEHLNRLFCDDYDLGALNQAVGEAKAAGQDWKHTAQVVITIPYPRVDQCDFGDVDGDGVSENMNVKEFGEEKALINRKKAVKWYVDEVYRRWAAAGYEHLELPAFYWYSEFMSRQTTVNEGALIRWTSD
ncbi:DUF4855 domain-containing protein [Paenibacillus thiaminolyticus]|uniref:DUF4855 domain-containing protein n=1 Tax=Paenibacillus thiaminolyticus TaxID=49283 RepID=UPI0035A675B3